MSFYIPFSSLCCKFNKDGAIYSIQEAERRFYLFGYQFIKLKETATRKEYQEHFGFESDKKAERHLKKMVDLNLIARKGSARSTYYEIIPT